MAIPTKIEQLLEQNGVMGTMEVGLSASKEDQAVIMDILSNKMYSNKPLALIREYSCNAVDAHSEAGISNLPIEITLPTIIAPELRIRDFGLGLSPNEIDDIYIKYGRSTKRCTNLAIGQLGLGCKAAFCYGDNFIVTSWKDGVKTI